MRPEPRWGPRTLDLGFSDVVQAWIRVVLVDANGLHRHTSSCGRVRFTGDRRLMGELVDGRATRVCARAAAAFVVAMNGYLVFSQLLG